jgi:DNA-binding transcriptional LysR family regulator
MNSPRITLEQWRAFHAVVEYGGYAQAAEALSKSQSTLSYAVQKLEHLLGVKVLAVEGRKARLTEAGEVLLRRSRQLVDSAAQVEKVARNLAQGIEPVIPVAIEVIFPYEDLLCLLATFSERFPQTRVELVESVLSGGHDLLLEGQVDLLVSSLVPPGFVGEPLMQVEFCCVTNPSHPLHQLGRDVTLEDLKQHRQIVTRDSGAQRRFSAPWLEAEQRWTVSNLSTSIKALAAGLGFAWVPRRHIEAELAQGLLQPLPLRDGARRSAQLYLVYRDRDSAGPATRCMVELLLEHGRKEDAALAAHASHTE